MLEPLRSSLFFIKKRHLHKYGSIVDNLVLDNLLGGVVSSTGKIIAPTLSIPFLPVIICLNLGPGEVPLFYAGMSIGVFIVQILFMQPYC